MEEGAWGEGAWEEGRAQSGEASLRVAWPAFFGRRGLEVNGTEKLKKR